MTNPAEARKDASNLITRGTDRVRRRAQQAQAKHIEVLEAADLVSPSGPEKTAAIAAAKVKQVDLGVTSKEVREKQQAVHAAQAVAEIARLGERTVQTPLAGFIPGQQVDHVTARRLMKQLNNNSRDENREAAQAAGRAVRDTLNAVRPQGAGRARRAAKHLAAAQKTT